MKKTILASAMAGALVATMGAQADVALSGQVSRALVAPNDHAGDELQFVDNNISGSRFRIKADHGIANGMKAGARLEAQIQSNKGSGHNGGTFKNTANAQDWRYQDLYLSGGFGKVSLGKGDGAGNGSTEVNLSGTDIIGTVAAADLYGGFLFGTGVKVVDVYDVVDAYSRNNRIRYDSNKFGGFSFAASYGQQETAELSVKFAGGTDIKYEVQAFVGSQGVDGTLDGTTLVQNGNDSMGFSGSVLLSNGLNATVSWSEVDSDLDTAEDRENVWAQLGYKMGKHALSVDYGETEDTVKSTSAKTNADTMGVSYVFVPAKGVELFAGYREYSLDDNTGTDPDFFTIGSRVKF